MARSLANKSNVVAPGGNYPYGRLKDKDGTPGTPVNEVTYGDFHQFFERMMALAGISANEQPDNSANTFQFIIALKTLMNRVIFSTATTVSSPAGFAWTDFVSYSLPAGAVTRNGEVIKVRGSGRIANNGNAKGIEVGLGGTTGVSISGFFATYNFWEVEMTIIRKSSTQYNSIARLTLTDFGVTVKEYIAQNVDAAIDWTIANDIKIRIQGTAASDVRGDQATIERDYTQ